MGEGEDGYFYVLDVYRQQLDSSGIERALVNIASQDGKRCSIRLPQDPGQAGKFQAKHFVKLLAGYRVASYPVTGSKYTRAQPVSAQVQAGNVRLLRAPWNEPFLKEVENFTGKAPDVDDQVDAFADAFTELTGSPRVRVHVG